MSTPTTNRRTDTPEPHAFRVLLAVTAGIAAYKAAELVRMLQREGIDVSVIQTPASEAFVGAATFTALTGATSTTVAAADAFPHLDAARDADLLLVAPATANSIARFANGLGDEIVSTTYLGFAGPVIVCPAMNVRMWRHSATQRNVERLRADGVTIIDPDAGQLACGDEGPGRLASLERIVASVLESRTSGSGRELDGSVVLVTTGGTREHLDDARCLSNRSSGRMGAALARAARARGATVRLIATMSVDDAVLDGLDPVARPDSAAELAAAVNEHAAGCDAIVMAAAVSDFTVDRAAGKLDRRTGTPTFELIPTTDILATLGAARAHRSTDASPDRPLLVGFAAESSADGLDRARTKLDSKQVDAIVYNDVSRSDIGFDSADNEVVIVTREGDRQLSRAPKSVIAEGIVDWVAQRLLQGETARPRASR